MPRQSLWIPPTIFAALTSLLALPARAEAPAAGHYHPDDIAAASTVFGSAADTVGPRYEAAAGTLRTVGSGLELLELGALSMGDTVPTGLIDWMSATRRQATGEHLRLQRHVDLMGEDYGTEFSAAMERALTAEGAGLVECGASGIAAMVGGKNCPGEDANARLAAVIDADPLLSKAIDSIGQIEWPAVSEPAQTWPVTPVTGAENWIQVGALVRALFPDRLMMHQDNLDRSLTAIQEDDSLSREAMIAAARTERDRYAKALAADGAVIVHAMTEALQKGAKKGAPTSVGLCANAPSLGGCTGTDVTRKAVAFLRDDKKFIKATAGLR